MISQHQYQVVCDELDEARDRIEDLKAMLRARTEEVDKGLNRYDKSVTKQRIEIGKRDKLIKELEQDRTIHDLEQQAKALDNFVIPDLWDAAFHKVYDALIYQAKNLREQAKQLEGHCE